MRVRGQTQNSAYKGERAKGPHRRREGVRNEFGVREQVLEVHNDVFEGRAPHFEDIENNGVAPGAEGAKVDQSERWERWEGARSGEDEVVRLGPEIDLQANKGGRDKFQQVR